MVSLIMTVLNEKETLPQWFRSYAEQSKKADELVIVDGGSIDSTWDYLQEMKNSLTELKIVMAPGNIAYGRNVAISAASGDIIVVTDAGCVYASDWLDRLTQPLLTATEKWSTTGFAPWFLPGDGLLTYLIAAATIPWQDEFRLDWSPSSRSVAFRRSLWENVGGYPEWIPYCEDVIFDKQIEKQEGRPFYIREPLVFWRPRFTIKTYLRQLFNYTKSEGHGMLNTERQLVRYGVYFGAMTLLILGIRYSAVWFVVLLMGASVYMPKFYLRWWKFTNKKNFFIQVVGLLFVPLVVLIGDIGKMAGYPVGLYERIIGKV